MRKRTDARVREGPRPASAHPFRSCRAPFVRVGRRIGSDTGMPGASPDAGRDQMVRRASAAGSGCNKNFPRSPRFGCSGRDEGMKEEIVTGDGELVERIRRILCRREGYSERRMFGDCLFHGSWQHVRRNLERLPDRSARQEGS